MKKTITENSRLQKYVAPTAKMFMVKPELNVLSNPYDDDYHTERFDIDDDEDL